MTVKAADACAHGAGKLLDLREVVVSLVETWRYSERPGCNALLPEILPLLLLAGDKAWQRELLGIVRTLIHKVLFSVALLRGSGTCKAAAPGGRMSIRIRDWPLTQVVLDGW